jgi:NAD(P)H dehydrogenase (quinone)
MARDAPATANERITLVRVFAIIGATGKVGGATVRALRERGAPVRAVVRDRARAADLATLGCEIAVADLDDRGAIARALQGATAAQVVCPMLTHEADAAGAMSRIVDSIAGGLRDSAPAAVLAISDYGAQLDAGTGITMTFHRLEAALRGLLGSVTFLRSAEHMQNWGRFAGAAAETGVLASLHQPLTKSFPTVSAPDVGVAAADLLLTASSVASPRVVHIEGPRRYTALDVAATLAELVGRPVAARALPRSDWVPALHQGGLGASYAELVATMFDAHNAGRIDADGDDAELRRGTTELRDVLASVLPSDR